MYHTLDASLEEAVLLAVTTRKTYEGLNEKITAMATELGELRSLEEFRKAIDRLDFD